MNHPMHSCSVILDVAWLGLYAKAVIKAGNYNDDLFGFSIGGSSASTQTQTNKFCLGMVILALIIKVGNYRYTSSHSVCLFY